jgi:hypothetical protein
MDKYVVELKKSIKWSEVFKPLILNMIQLTLK